MNWLVVAVLITMIIGSDTTVTLTVYPRVVLAGSGVRVQCRVLRHESNRAVTWGFTEWTSTSRQLDGATARITWESTYDHVPCEPGAAFCAVERVGKPPIVLTRTLVVTGCER